MVIVLAENILFIKYIKLDLKEIAYFIVMYFLYLYFLGLSLRIIDKALTRFKDRISNYVTVWNLFHGFFHLKFTKEKDYFAFKIDETDLPICGKYF